MKFAIGQTVYLNNPSLPAHGRSGTVTRINPRQMYPYRVDFDVIHVFHPEDELSAKPVLLARPGRKLSKFPVHLKKLRATPAEWEEFKALLTGDARKNFLLLFELLKQQKG